MSCTVTSAKICCCAAVSLTLLGERVDGKAPVTCSPDRPIVHQKNSAVLWMSFCWGPELAICKACMETPGFKSEPSTKSPLSLKASIVPSACWEDKAQFTP